MNPSYPEPYDVFISGSPADADWLHDALLTHLYRAELRADISIQSMNLDPYQQPLLEQRVGQARHVLALLSPDSLSNPRAGFERDIAQALDYSQATYRLLPARLPTLGTTLLPARLALLRAVDFANPEQTARAIAELIQTIRGPRLTQADVDAQTAARTCPYPDPSIATAVLETDALRHAILASAEKHGISVEAALVNRLAKEVHSLLKPTQTSILSDDVRRWLQQTMALLWERRERSFMTLRSYETLAQQGDAPLARAIVQHAATH